MPENVIILEPGDERAQKIAKAMGSQTASDILRILSEGQKTLTEITDQLDLPLTTVKYHIENLLDAGIVRIIDTKYSIKGREVKLYSLSEQLFIVAPRQSNVRSILLKYASLFGIVALGTLVISLILPVLSSTNALGGGAATVASAVPAPAVQREAGVMAAKMAYDNWGASSAIAPDQVLSFFIGGVFVIIVLLIHEAYLWKKR